MEVDYGSGGCKVQRTRGGCGLGALVLWRRRWRLGWCGVRVCAGRDAWGRIGGSSRLFGGGLGGIRIIGGLLGGGLLGGGLLGRRGLDGCCCCFILVGHHSQGKVTEAIPVPVTLCSL